MASSFGLGYLPIAPGTWGSLGGIALYFALYRLQLVPYLVTLFALIVLSSWIADRAEVILGKKDPGVIVIDEVVGMLTALTFLPITWEWVLAAFLLFRLFDIWKPFPARWIQDHAPGGWGVVGDDVMAGIYANLILQIAVRYLWG